MSTKNLLTLENGTNMLSWNVCSKLQLTLCSIPRYVRLYAGLFRPFASCRHFYLSFIIRTIICHIHGTEQTCIALWSYLFLFLFIQLMHWIGYRCASRWRRNILFPTTNCVTSHFLKNLNQEKKWRNQMHFLQEWYKWLLWRSLGSWQTLLRMIFTVHLQLVSTEFCCSYCAVYLYPVYSPGDCCSAQ